MAAIRGAGARPAALLAVATVVLAAGASGAAAEPATPSLPGAPYAPQYYFAAWRVPQLWASGARGQGVTIAEIDTGVDAALAVFGGRVLPGKDFGRLGGDGRTDRDAAAYGHGTSMASIMIGAPGRFGIAGLAPGARLLPVAIPIAGTTDAASEDRLPSAIRWAADHGAKIISMSLAGGAQLRARNTPACPGADQAAIYHALHKGAVLVAAGGNRGAGDNAPEEPGACQGVMSVGAVDGAGTVAAFSSRHQYLTLSAPGVEIASIGRGGAPFAGAGTSQATALAAAAAALVWSGDPGLSASQLVARLLATLDRRRSTPDPGYGYGTINPYRALTRAVPREAANPVSGFAQRLPARAHAPAPPARPRSEVGTPPDRGAAGSSPHGAGRRLVGVVASGGGLVVLLVLLVGAAVRRRRHAPDDPE